MTSVIPTDIIFTHLLPKLPAKSLIRFKCVSKSFLTEISSPEFIKLHHDNAKHMLILSCNYRAMYLHGNRGLIPPFNQRNMNIYNLDSLHALPSVSQYPKPEGFTGSIMRLVGACESYLLIGYNRIEYLGLFNPSTHTYRELPRNSYSTYFPSDPIYGMCHCVDDEFKILRMVQYQVVVYYADIEYQIEIMIYSLRTNTWKFIERKRIEQSNISNNTTEVLVQNHLFHLIFMDYNGSEYFPSRIGCFDIQAEQWADDVPFSINLFNFNKSFDLCSLDGKLCIAGLNLDLSTYDVYIMNDYGVEESWVKLMSLPTSNRSVESYHPIAYRVGSAHEVLCRRNHNGALFWYNLGDKQVLEPGFDGVPHSMYCLAYTCKGSLLNFPGGQLIRPSSEEEDD